MTNSTNNSAILVLQSGHVFQGKFFGLETITFGECVFTTAQTGYCESLTDPSYAGQILCFANPLIGNIGMSNHWQESEKMYASGVIVSSISDDSFHNQETNTVEQFLIKNQKPGISDLDTRRLVKILRDEGNQPCVLITGQERIKMLETIAFDFDQNISPKSFEELIKFVDNQEDIGFLDWAKKVSTNRFERVDFEGDNKSNNKTIVILDCGVKMNIVREVSKRVSRLIILPADASCEQIMQYQPDGVLLSNGPGDPRDYIYAIETIKKLLICNIPIMGICLGHQLLALAIGANVYKMKFGNRGSNQPVQDLTTNLAYLTSQNHGYAVDAQTIPNEYKVYFKNLNDQSVEGIIHKLLPIFSIQFHPEACGGPQDTNFLFESFITHLSQPPENHN